MVRMHELVDDLDCTVTYDHEVKIREDGVDVSVLCFEDESDIKVFCSVQKSSSFFLI